MTILKFRVALILGMFLSVVCLCPASAETVSSQKHRFRVVTVVEGLEHPWGLAFLPDGGMLVTERPGRLRLVRQGRLDPQPVEGLPAIAAKGQGGLLDVALHPDFAQNRLVYISFAAAGEGGIGTEVARGRLNGHRLEGVQTIFRLQPKSDRGIHFGSRLVFDRAGYLFITLGDRGEMARAQKWDDHAGSVIRLHDDGRVPADNPYKSHSGWKPEIYSIGHRNVQGAALHPQTGELWAHEHGPQGGDEINIIRAGNNYGWPVITYGVNYGLGTRIGMGTHRQGMIQPLHYWVPTSIAPSGMAFYEGDRFVHWQGDLFVGALREEMLVRLRFEGTRVVEEEHLLKDALGRIRDVRSGPDGYLYLLTDHRKGKLVRLEPLGEKER
ncbi:PQQ-dependent sugar dehydrogenase [Desulfuromonas sp. KJ2020]|uniref:PQQ-dependent sugar dehydrogenase n=1 Tax=Desulfuromonas sp. KJ2020 TaxID=2919173 RepID=UPI0020A7A7CF|nr:PQQ-dependent sugar dehydrogenase [Desulfuromonas sp. KJ2020]MCP3176394.1 PQQ-dependent sugar dehydrogenase [Desulfuromonas sp. KJ2020]